MRRAQHIVALLVLLAGTFMAGSWYTRRTISGRNLSAVRKIAYYTCPMHPQYRSERPGIAPCCGMRLEPVDAESGPAYEPRPGTVNVSAGNRQRLGIRVSTVEKASGTYPLRLLGRVAPDETRVYKLVAGVDGFIREISPVTTGSQVRRDQWLATFSAPEARPPVQGYLVTLSILDQQKQGGMDSAAQTRAAESSSQLAVERLLNIGVSGAQIEEIRRTREVPAGFRILAPGPGFVLARNVSMGQKFDRGMEWYRIADLNRVWILADVFPAESQHIRPGQVAEIKLTGGRTVFTARVSDVLPQFDGATRTLKVRLEADNPGYALRPDMFVDVEISVVLPSTTSVPVDAVRDSGLAKTVFVDRGNGSFEPRPVETGWRFGDRVQIVKGLQPGERIVTSGNFLIDSESRMKLAGVNGAPMAEKTPAVKDPVCGMNVDPSAPHAVRAQYRGKTYFFCSDRCRTEVEANPGRYLPKTMTAHGAAGKQGPA